MVAMLSGKGWEANFTQEGANGKKYTNTQPIVLWLSNDGETPRGFVCDRIKNEKQDRLIPADSFSNFAGYRDASDEVDSEKLWDWFSRLEKNEAKGLAEKRPGSWVELMEVTVELATGRALKGKFNVDVDTPPGMLALDPDGEELTTIYIRTDAIVSISTHWKVFGDQEQPTIAE
jgi:hypothetical protein